MAQYYFGEITKEWTSIESLGSFDSSKVYIIQNQGTSDLYCQAGSSTPTTEAGFIIRPKSHLPYKKGDSTQVLYIKMNGYTGNVEIRSEN